MSASLFAWIAELASRIRVWLSPRAVDQEFEREMDSHLELMTEENMQRGMGREEARRAARMRLGGVTQLKETNRELQGFPVLETFLQDVRFALRMLRKNPGFTAVAVLTLALGIGANTAIFSVVYAVVLKPLPYPHAEQLVNVFAANAQEGIAGTGISYANFVDLRAQGHIFTELAVTQFHQLTLTGHGEPAIVDSSVVTPQLFSLLEQKPIAGRTFFPDDGKVGAPPVVLLSENLWRASFGADPSILGNSINLDKRPFTVVGVMPAAFRYPALTSNGQVWIPLAQDPLFGSWLQRRGGHWLRVIGRLKPGVSQAQVEGELAAISARLAKEFPAENSGWTIHTLPLQQMIVGDVKPSLLVLLGAVGLVLLIACANIANLLLTRATSRAREMAVRSALGAGRIRIIRQLLSETAVLGLLGGAVGIALAYWGVQSLTSFLPADLPRTDEIRVDHFVLGFAVILSILASCGFGLAPALFAADSHLQMSLREGGRSGESGKQRRARGFLAAGEIALAMVLLVGAGLLLRSFANLVSMSPGFDPAHIVKADISLPQFQYATPQQWAAFSSELLERVQSEPGMRDSAFVVPVPIAQGKVNLAFDIAGSPSLSAGSSRLADYVSVSPEYFRVMGIRLLAGREFNAHDVIPSPRVTMISDALARRYFPNQDPLGKRLTFGFPLDSAGPREIVGIVADVRDIELGQAPEPMMYVPFAQAPFWGGAVVVKSTLSASSVAAALRADVRKIDKDLPVTDVATMPELLRASVEQPRFRTFLLGTFAAMALVLAAVGIFGVISYSVSCRTREIGIRVALGSSRTSILRMILRETLTLTVAGLALGVPCALVASRLAKHMLFGVSANDPATFSAVAAGLATVALLAAYVPARRAMRVDPMVALRHE
ncbi:MAG TPA: ABC transporter permease [Candidatus Dormibacteraeota bacterium]|nr:ABC transporter permease [Candidatus Dormibacteraeota bacterium]